MKKFLLLLLAPVFSPVKIQLVWLFLRVTIGIMITFHGVPKITGGPKMWRNLGTFVNPLGIYFWPLMWGFLGACTEIFGGMLLTVGLLTRFASFCLVIMMFVAVSWHLSRSDSYNLWSFPLSLIFVFGSFFILGGGIWSLDYLLSTKL